MTPAASQDARNRMTAAMASGGALSSPAWTTAFASVPREVFAPSFSLHTEDGERTYHQESPEFLDACYTDTSLITQRDTAGTPISSSSAPSLMARMLEAFTVSRGDRVLEIGTGTGYNTALLCHHLGSDSVTSVDIDPGLTVAARDKLARLGYGPTINTGDGTAGYQERAPYDGILATCGVRRIPAAWLAQTRPGGIIVTNIGTGIVRLTVEGNGAAAGAFLPDSASFMIARPAADHVAHTAPAYTGLIMNAEGRSRTQPIPEVSDGAGDYLDDLMRAEALEVSLNQLGVLAMTLIDKERGRKICGLIHPATSSWARVTLAGETTVTIEHGGPLDLAAERLELFAQWIRAGRPGPGNYGLAVGTDGVHTLWRDAETDRQSWVLPS
ncbi:methyltransferase domain-containing protein [Streptomyces sp. DSM 44938]|uniref:Protein-L-isoaspartate O-methyltransferase n=2 Tax=Streptomyces litchfieldiae TaxID=3075543 RepID=A0ABU2MWC6_9ACTN|nr:methyltransferase domain-containing protein [Streptomyces sp. DSM 44938]